MKKILMIMGVACLAVSGRADTLLLSDNFNTKSESLAAFNSTLSTDQGGTLKPVTYTLANGGADWQIQHGNAAGGYQMLLAGSPVNANRDLYASLNHNFATEANTADEPLKIQFNIKITTVTANWATIAVGSVQNAFVTSGSYKFSSLFRGTSTSPQGTQQFTAGTDLGSANFTYVNNDQITLVLSDAAGTGSAFNGNATAKVYVNGTLKYTKTGLNFTAADGYISFEAYFVDGYYDNLAVSLVGTKTVTYNGNGSTSGTAPTDGTTYDSGALVTVLGNPGSLAKTGYNFAGWNTQADGNGTTYAQGSTFTISTNTTLYAKWTTGYAVTYSGNGNTGGTAPTDNNTYSSGTPVTVLGNTGSLTKTGYTFTGWTNSSGTHYAGGDTFSIVAATTLFAEWMINQYTLTYSAGPNGTLTGTTPQTVNYGASGTAVTAVPSAGYRFVVWSDGVLTASRTDTALVGGTNVTATFDNNLVWNNSAGTTNWNTTDSNWTGIAWNNTIPDNAVFSGAATNTLTLTENIKAGSVTLTAGAGYTLDANGYALLVAGDLAVSETTLRLTNGTFGFNRVITTNNSGSADWGALTIRIGATVTVTNGIDGSVGSPYTFALNLNGGDLYTPSIKVADLHQSWGNSYLTFNGTTVHATTDNSDFIQTYGGYGNNNTLSIANGGAIIDTAGHAITITESLINLASNSGSLTKKGNGTLTLSGTNIYTGTTTVSGGTLALSGNNTNKTGATTVQNGAILQLQANPGNTSGGISTALSATGNTGLSCNSGGSVQLRADSSVTFAGGDGLGGLGNATINIDVNQLTTGNANQTLTLAPNGFETYQTTINISGGNGYALALGAINKADNSYLTLNANSANLSVGAIGATVPVTTLTVGGAANAAITGAINGTTLTKTGNGTLTLSGVNTYTGNTTISGGTLALSSSGSIGNSANIVVAGNAIFNVSGLSSAFTLGSQTLSNSAPGAIINGTNNCSTGTVSLVYDGVNPSFTITNGGMTLSAATTLEVNNTAAQLPHGTNKLIARATGGNVGLVAGTLPAVTISGGGAAAPVSLQIVSGELYLNVNNPPMANAKSYSVAQGGIITIAVASGSKSLATDVDGDTLTVTSLGDTNAVDFGTASITGGGSNITYANTSGSAGSESLFSYIVSDGFGGLATNSITIRLDPATGANLISATAGGGNAYLTYAGIPGTNYALDHATSITPPITWVQEEFKPAGGDGTLRFTNLLSTWPTNDFYRTRYVP